MPCMSEFFSTNFSISRIITEWVIILAFLDPDNSCIKKILISAKENKELRASLYNENNIFKGVPCYGKKM